MALGFDLLMLNGDDLRRRPLVERKAALGKLLLRSHGGIQYVEHAEGHGEKMFAAVCDLGLEGIVSKKLECAVSLRAVAGVDQGQEPEGTCCDAYSRGDILRPKGRGAAMVEKAR